MTTRGQAQRSSAAATSVPWRQSSDLRPTKRLGQNFVTDPNTVRRIVRAARVGPDDVVLEVGPGLGSLTLALLPHVGRVLAVEIDESLAARLPITVGERLPAHADRLDVMVADALRLEGLPVEPTALVANLPYNVAVPVVLHLLSVLPSIGKVLVMVQKEVADRLAAQPGNRVYGIPSVKARWYCDVEYAGSIGTSVFWPAPHVDSGLVRMTRCQPPVSNSGREATFAVVDAAFSQRRKTLRAALSRFAGGPDRSEAALLCAGVRPSARGEELTIGEFARISDCLAAADAQDRASTRIPHSLRNVAPSSVTVRVPAKVNLQLSVGPVRPDGFHEVATVYQAVSLFDEIVVRPSSRAGITLTLSGEGEGELPLDGDNLAYRAVAILADHVGLEPAVEVHIHKAIPIAGGMAGGSADAAASLLACDALWRQATPRDELNALAAELGSDVPFALNGGTAIGTGRGENLTSRAVARNLPLGLCAGGWRPTDAGGIRRVRSPAWRPQGA